MKDTGAGKTKKLRGCLITILGIVLIVAIGFFGFRPDQTTARHSLPYDATDIHEWEVDFGFLPDFRYQLKAKITKEEFERYVVKLGLTPHTPGRRQYTQSPVPWLSWKPQPGFVGDWWDPSESLDKTFVRQQGDFWEYAKYENGYLYHGALDH